jgi:hypothetical protein
MEARLMDGLAIDPIVESDRGCGTDDWGPTSATLRSITRRLYRGWSAQGAVAKLAWARSEPGLEFMEGLT